MLHCLELRDLQIMKEVTNYVLIMEPEFSVSSYNHTCNWTRCWTISIPVLYLFQMHCPPVEFSTYTVGLLSYSFPNKILYASLRDCIVLTIVNGLFKLQSFSFCNILNCLLASPFLVSKYPTHNFVSRYLFLTQILTF